ncbi:unnamed protein product [Adineta ricciae]|uniref:Uncharacterized protein n=1 Tax=Adineta ricciae TaxID=249248 RepID=A0A815PXI0_ADIRI|nr:unnamed protein product [Adineta ricciae]
MSLPINTCPVDNVAPAGEPRATFMFAAVVLLLVAGSYNSEFVLELLPPANNTFPFNNNVAVCSFRGLAIPVCVYSISKAELGVYSNQLEWEVRCELRLIYMDHQIRLKFAPNYKAGSLQLMENFPTNSIRKEGMNFTNSVQNNIFTP